MRLSTYFFVLFFLAASAFFFLTTTTVSVPRPAMQERGLKPREPPSSIIDVIGGLPGRPTETPMIDVIGGLPGRTKESPGYKVIGGLPGRPQEDSSTPAPAPAPAKIDPVDPVDPVDPPGNLICEHSPTGPYMDAHFWPMASAVTYFCKDFANPPGDHNPAQLPIKRTIFHWKNEAGPWNLVRDYENVEWEDGYLKYWLPGSKRPDHGQDDIYDLTISRIDGCELKEGQRWNFTQPLHGEYCRRIMRHAWKECINWGRGGSLDAGCLRYTVKTKF